MDSRIKTLAKNLIQYSVSLKAGENVLIYLNGNSGKPLVKALVREAYQAGGFPHVLLKDPQIERELMMGADGIQMNFMGGIELAQMKGMQAYIGIRAADNVTETSDVPSDKMKIYQKNYSKPVLDRRVNFTKWCVMRYPNESMAQLSNTSTEAFEDFYFDVCTLDYSKMSVAMDALVEKMQATDRVRIVGPGTELTFSIKDIPAIKCDGKYNIPDGEVFTAPVKNSVNGTLQYNCPAVYEGVTYDNIKLTFKDGKIVEATANETERINAVFDTDEGARYIGEFAIGVNPYILDPMKDTLFDEKIMGSFHFTPGEAYEDADNGNKSSVHWDLVCIQTPTYGGGEIYFDDVLIRKDGLFVIPELLCLNPDQLK